MCRVYIRVEEALFLLDMRRNLLLVTGYVHVEDFVIADDSWREALYL